MNVGKIINMEVFKVVTREQMSGEKKAGSDDDDDDEDANADYDIGDGFYGIWLRDGVIAGLKSLATEVRFFRDQPEGSEIFGKGVLQFVGETGVNLDEISVQPTASSIAKAEINAVFFRDELETVSNFGDSFYVCLPNYYVDDEMTEKRKLRCFGRISSPLNSEGSDSSGDIIPTMAITALNEFAGKSPTRPTLFDLLTDHSLKGIFGSGGGFDEISDNAVRTVVEIQSRKTSKVPTDDVGEMVLVIPTFAASRLRSETEDYENSSDIGSVEQCNSEKNHGNEERLEGSQSIQEAVEALRKLETSTFFRNSNNILLLWFLAVSVLVLLFPAAYFVKILLRKAVDYYFPLKDTHQKLVTNCDLDDINIT